MAKAQIDLMDVGGGGAQEVYHDTTATITSAGWNTGCKLSDINLFIVYSNSYARMVFAKNDNGSLQIVRNTGDGSGYDTSLTVDGSGYLVFSCTNSSVSSSSAEAYGYK